MPKIKRFRNMQKSTPQPQCVENTTTEPSGNSSPTNPIVSSPMIEAQPPSSQHVGRESSLPTENTQQTETSTLKIHNKLKHPHMLHVNPHYPLKTQNKLNIHKTSWTSIFIVLDDLAGVIKKIKVKVKEVKNLPCGERIIVEFDEIGMPISEGQGVLAGYYGILATDGNLFPINLERWSRIAETNAQRYCKLTVGRKWAAHRQNLWNEFYVPAKTKDQIISNVPTGIERSQWAHFVTYRLKPETLFMEIGQLPSRGKLYIETHKKEDGSFVNDAAKDIAVSPNDVVGKVLGPAHSGRVRCMGLGAAPTNAFRNTRLQISYLSLASSTTVSSSSSNQWQQKYNNLESALKAYMIMKEGKIPDEFTSFFDSQPQEGGDANELESPLGGTIGSSGASNI
ncbi:hypothetical protein V8G54_001312 [Vigna mungo]|uniref:Transposase Tnp1/En/Spm-like domain-containing protein n=1 Tax=Vigna mungo TaxID=3915 RepID=A0AAQ3P724_VIGMU